MEISISEIRELAKRILSSPDHHRSVTESQVET
jgi:hypothetical protein